MKVKELIEELQKLDPELPVFYLDLDPTDRSEGMMEVDMVIVEPTWTTPYVILQ